ncbi:aminoacyl-tRNA hydrolase [Hankyongella ginsenosidimutans]|uniref:Peptidyl-tRNA hydrolase n=1 Tax=Hankyongella ginsenosidimutans TaxID=1763828 RepID=A0A4D7CC75_9SPHN|nr:aminoacyl-tRNA hydrolase [Hankyongella ginsenosidimutans]QCI79852.1 aminoacyl-tRNA hydrolase [Hankyongella ginsenosidimutans]
MGRRLRAMLIWVGLGNPGAQYAGHRHNIGFMALDRIADRHGFSPWRTRFQGLACEGHVEGAKLLLLAADLHERKRPFGRRGAAFFKAGVDQLCVFHDELDLAAGKLKLKIGGGAAGHNGLRSIDAHCGQNYRRVRLGIGHPGHKDRVTGHVLGNFSKADADWLEPLLDALAAEAGWLAKGMTPVLPLQWRSG